MLKDYENKAKLAEKRKQDKIDDMLNKRKEAEAKRTEAVKRNVSRSKRYEVLLSIYSCIFYIYPWFQFFLMYSAKIPISKIGKSSSIAKMTPKYQRQADKVRKDLINLKHKQLAAASDKISKYQKSETFKLANLKSSKRPYNQV